MVKDMRENDLHILEPVLSPTNQKREVIGLRWLHQLAIYLLSSHQQPFS